MTRTRILTALVLCLGLTTMAWAQKKETGGHMGNAGAPMGAAKIHFALLDLYVTQAMMDAKILNIIAEDATTAGKLDKASLKEIQPNLDKSLSAAMKQVQAIKSMKAQMMGAAGDGSEKQDVSGSETETATSGTGDMSALERQLKEAQSASKGLRKATADNIGTALDPLNAALVEADMQLTTFATSMGIQRLSEMQLQSVPVKGTEPAEKPETEKPDTEKQPGDTGY